MQQAPLTAEWLDIPAVSVGDRFHARLRFSHPITGLEASDLRLRRFDGTFFNPSSDDVTFIDAGENTYLLVFNMTGQLSGTETYRLRLVRDSVNFINGTGPGGSLNSEEFTIDVSISPTATISFTETEGVAGVALTGRVAFNQPVSGLGASHFSAENGTVGAFTEIDSRNYEVEVTPDAGSGTLTLTLAADAVNEGNAEASAEIPYTDPTPPPPTDAVLDITVNPASVTAGGIATVTFTFDKAVGGFHRGCCGRVSEGATKGTLTDEGNNVWTLPVTATQYR